MPSELPAAAAGSMTLGGDLIVRRMGFGAMRLTGQGIWGDPPDRAKAQRVLRRAVELGVNLIDTADSYGPEVSERSSPRRSTRTPPELVIATKGGLTRSGPGQWHRNGRPEHLRKACEGSLRRLRLERIDLYQLHAVDPAVPMEDSLGELIAPPGRGEDPAHRAVERERRSARAGTGAGGDRLGAEPVQPLRPGVGGRARGLRAGRAGVPALVSGGSRRPRPARAARWTGWRRRHAVTPAQVALAWLLLHSPVMLPIPGTSSVAHLEENVAAAALSLDDAEMLALERG